MTAMAAQGARSESALASLLLTNRFVDAGAAPLSAGRYWALLEAVPDPAELLASPAAEIGRRTGLPPDDAARIERLLATGTGLAFELERMEQRGFVPLTCFDDAYPGRLRERLGDQAPPVLTTVGNRDLLSSEGIGIVGSRGVTKEGAEVARNVAEQAASSGLTTISGGAKGVDQESMSAAHAAQGPVVGFLADSLERRIREPATRRAVADGLVCLATPFKPSAGFSVAGAMARNKLVYATARVTLVVASDLGRGGTWEGAVEALHHGYGTVAVWRGPGGGPGNERLVALGATPVVDVPAVFRAQAGPVTAAGSDQLRLGL